MTASISKILSAAIRRTEPAVNSGVAIAVVQRGELIYLASQGLRNRSTSAPVTQDSLFALGSLTKGFTALAISLLSRQIRFSLESPITAIEPGFKTSVPAITRRLTWIDALSHRTGMPGHNLIWMLTPFGRNEVYRRLRHLGFPVDSRANFRRTFLYNNVLYAAVGCALEKLAMKSWERYVSEKILLPLKMPSSTADFARVVDREDVAEPYAGDSPIERKNIESIGPAGSLHASIRDMAQWLLFLLGTKRLSEGDDEIVKNLLLPRITTPFTPKMLAPLGLDWVGGKIQYGMGWYLGRFEKKRLAFAPGNIDGFSSIVALLPAEKSGVIVLSNQDSSDLPGVVAGATIRFLSGRSGAKPRKRALATTSPKIHRAALSWPKPRPLRSPIQEFVGEYRNDGYGGIRLALRRGKPTLVFYGSQWELSEESENRLAFVIEAMGRQKAPVELVRKPHGGRSLRIRFDESEPPVDFMRIY